MPDEKPKKQAEKPKEKPKPKPEMVGSGLAQRAGSALQNRRREQEKALGLKDGGKIKARPRSGAEMPGPETRRPHERPPMPKPKKAPGTPKRDERLSPRGYKDGGKVVKSSTNC